MSTPTTRYGSFFNWSGTVQIPADADSLPTVTLEVNGAADTTGTVVTVSHAETGRYRYSYPLAAFKPGDQILEIGRWTYSGNAVMSLAGTYILSKDVATTYGRSSES